MLTRSCTSQPARSTTARGGKKTAMMPSTRLPWPVSMHGTTTKRELDSPTPYLEGFTRSNFLLAGVSVLTRYLAFGLLRYLYTGV